MENVINRFDGEYFFLSNFYQCTVTYNGITYGSSEAAFQAQKTLDIEKRKYFATLDPSKSKREGRRLVDLRSDWDDIKDKVMYEIVMAKFIQNPNLADKLLDTGDKMLVEGNGWNDRYWGMDYGCTVGRNQLGKTLMAVRENVRMIRVTHLLSRVEEQIEELKNKAEQYKRSLKYLEKQTESIKTFECTWWNNC